MKVYKSKLIEFGPTATSQQQYYFPDQSDLRNTKIFGIQTYSTSNVTTTYSGYTLPAVADVANLWVVLYFNGGNYITEPMIKLINTQNNATTGVSSFTMFPFALMGQVIEWQKCFVWYGTTSGLTTGRYFAFNVYYQD